MSGLAPDGSTLHAEAFRLQARQCQSLGSPMYAGLFEFLAEQCATNVDLVTKLASSRRPVHDAAPLRLAGEVHRQVLEGKASSLSRHFPTVGGRPHQSFPSEFLDHILSDDTLIDRALTTQVQTNEVRRSVVLRQAARWLHAQGHAEFTLLEVGSSAGLNLWFDRYPAEWFADTEPPLPGHFAGREASTMSYASARMGCDIHPLDVRDDVHVIRLRSFVWPDQTSRHERLLRAIDIARSANAPIKNQSADRWVEENLAMMSGATVVFHSIVWQYLGATTQSEFRKSLIRYGARAKQREPLIWLRMEPQGALADLRATVWTGAHEPAEWVLADVGYHGESFAWRPSLSMN